MGERDAATHNDMGVALPACRTVRSMPIDIPPVAPARARRVVSLPVMLWVVVVLIGAFLGGYLLFRATGSGGSTLTVQGVVTSVSDDGKTAVFRQDSVAGPGETVRIDVTTWIDAGGKHIVGNKPACLQPGSLGQRIELGVIDLPSLGNGPSKIVVWVHCLS